MTLRIGDTAPNFTAETTEGTIDFHQWIGNGWAVLYSHPADFTPICTTELGRTAQLKADFGKRDAKVIAISVDSVDDHRRWIEDINETQNTTVNFPIIGDKDRKVAELYEMIHPNASETVPVRSVFFIDPNKKIRAMITYPPATGRNFNEILRVVDALQLTDNYQVATPVDWNDGDDVVILPSIADEQAKSQFPKGFKTLRPYLRMTPQPNK